MNTAKPNSKLTLVLKTNLFNDAASVENALQAEQTHDTLTVDISESVNSNFTDVDWDNTLNTILSSSKVITV